MEERDSERSSCAIVRAERGANAPLRALARRFEPSGRRWKTHLPSCAWYLRPGKREGQVRPRNLQANPGNHGRHVGRSELSHLSLPPRVRCVRRAGPACSMRRSQEHGAVNRSWNAVSMPDKTAGFQSRKLTQKCPLGACALSCVLLALCRFQPLGLHVRV